MWGLGLAWPSVLALGRSVSNGTQLDTKAARLGPWGERGLISLFLDKLAL